MLGTVACAYGDLTVAQHTDLDAGARPCDGSIDEGHCYFP
jgi:hypothetical protein